MKLTFLFVFTSILSFSQVDNYEVLDINNSSATMGDEGLFFNNPILDAPGYEIPKNSGTNTIFYGSLMIGVDDVNNVFHTVGKTYHTTIGQNEFRSGPIANENEYTSVDYSTKYEKSIWKMTQSEISYHIENFDQQGYVMPASITDWPGNGDVSLGVTHQLAPFIDLNSNGLYEPTLGDYPKIFGGSAVYIIIHDKSFSAAGPMGVEVHMMFYQYQDGGYLNDATFLSLQVFNRGTTNFYNYRQSLFLDFDIGCPFDDFSGCDTLNQVVYGYNSDDLDENCNERDGYYASPPCQGVVSLSHDLYSFCNFYGSGDWTGGGYYNSIGIKNIMEGYWADGTPWVSPETGSPTRYMYSGNPYTGLGWNEIDTGNLPYDRRGFMTIAEDEFLVDSYICSDYAFIYNKSNSNLRNVQNVINIAGALREGFNTQNSSPCLNESVLTTLDLDSFTFEISPNPSNGKFSIRHNSPLNNCELFVRDLSGRLIYSQPISHSLIDIQLDEQPGVYYISIFSNETVRLKKVVIQ